MVNIVAYPDISLEKFTGLDPSEDVADFLSLIERKSELSFGVRPVLGDARNDYDARRKELFGSVLRGPAAQCSILYPQRNHGMMLEQVS